MKKILYTRPDGGLSIASPAEGARLAYSITLADGRAISSKTPVRIDQFLRVWPVAGATAEWAETEGEFLDRIAEKSVPKDAAGVRIVDTSEIPTDRTFRNAWKDGGSVPIAVDMVKARDIHRDKLRAMRAPKFAPLDAAWFKAAEAGDQGTKAEIGAQKQALRDVTIDPAIDAAASPDELAAVVQDCLK